MAPKDARDIGLFGPVKAYVGLTIPVFSEKGRSVRAVKPRSPSVLDGHKKEGERDSCLGRVPRFFLLKFRDDDTHAGAYIRQG